MTKRVITGTIFTLLVLAGIWFGGAVMLALLALAMTASVYEVYRAMENGGEKPVCWAGYLFCILTAAAQFVCMKRGGGLEYCMIALSVSALAAMAHLVLCGKVAVERMTATLLPMLYPGVFYIFLMQLLTLKNEACVTAALLLAFFAASINDVFALFSGMLFGKHKLSPELSPKKTKEGSVGGLIGSIAFSAAVPTLAKLVFSFRPGFAEALQALPSAGWFALLGLIAGILSQIGDLTASMVKRHYGVKDYGKILPGHGGIMDRLDGILFCGTACYIFFKIAGLG